MSPFKDSVTKEQILLKIVDKNEVFCNCCGMSIKKDEYYISINNGILAFNTGDYCMVCGLKSVMDKQVVERWKKITKKSLVIHSLRKKC